MSKITPMMQQYYDIKNQYPDAFLFFRLGDFYELFFDDAELAARELEITLTRRGKGEDAAPMCGVPYHSAENYIARLIDKGYKIAICEQVEDPQTAKGVVKREVIRVVTPGTIMEERAVTADANHYIAALSGTDHERLAYVRTDLTTGETDGGIIGSEVTDIEKALLVDGLREVIFPREELPSEWEKWMKTAAFTISYEENEDMPDAYHHLYNGSDPSVRAAFGRMLHYLARTQKRSLAHLQALATIEPQEFLQMDVHTRRNLELTASLRERKKKGSLYHLLDDTKTAMGSRMLHRFLERPLANKSEVERRQTLVHRLVDDMLTRAQLQDQLKNVYDLERLVGRVAYGNVNARELVQLRTSLQQVPEIVQTLPALGDEGVRLIEDVDVCDALRARLEAALVDDPPIAIREGGMIRRGFHEELDEYREASENGKTWLSNLEHQERAATGIKTLKVGYNRVFGYYIEISKAQLPHTPDYFERKQTLTNAERFITPELKEMENRILEAEEKMGQLEFDLFKRIREETNAYIPHLQQLAQMIAYVDCLQSFAQVSEERRFTRPQFSETRKLALINSRHPVVETTLERGAYVANDVRMDDEREQLLITGPNMAGKSTYMRQIAIIAVMAQIGCFVPADEATLPLFDKIFTRIGAADDLVSGQSTFMVEMLETEHALKEATSDSLLLLDEIGRGTSTYDGMALARSIVEYIHGHIGAKTLFSTHYHELTILEDELETLWNVHVRAEEEAGEVIFLHKVEEGRADKSYGIHVAQLARLPDTVIERARTLLDTYENVPQENTNDLHEQVPLFTYQEEKKPARAVNEKETTELAKVTKQIRDTDLLNLTPLEAMQAIGKWQKQLRSKS
ncbi:DNA mismatch repair protein MutS [Salicibibacter cibi]|uniref:DNA mismatch repair protein MutS n=1 Tax=Salicibibacter cibi TaxID=2743001 RepID=A0A7T6ZB07_9BACI|nr:DNA mismatch repair protein MutS [Salicibibacter cibi]QQK80173.1 DNA mismatch repair protein MutS [Salicibibacter cibi]